MPTTRPKTVLLVEDDALLRECLAELLGDAGWQVATAAGAAEALDWLDADGAPDVLVTDLWLGSGMNGLALIAEARHRSPRLHAVLMSGAELGELDVHTADRFLAKPFSMDDLVQSVDELTQEAAAAG